MDKNIPIYFDTVIVASPIEQISESEPNIGRLKVGVFTKYGNRNGSYITDAVAEELIQSAIKGNTPVVGFFDPETKEWASHTGPSLANAYGYVESFEGWGPFEDTDGETREYAVFSVVLFTEYFEEAKMIVGQHQSMELNINSIDGDWADFDGIEYFVYTHAQIQGLCIIGSHEPCFSVSTFFSKDDDNYASQYEKFSSLLSDLKARVEGAENGGEKNMENFEELAEEQEQKVETIVEEEKITEEVEPEVTVDFEALYNELKEQYELLQTQYAEAQNQISELEQTNSEMTQIREENSQLQATLTSAQETIKEYELAKKNMLIEKYEKLLDEEKIADIKASVSNFTYDELESKLAILFANSNMQGSEHVNKKVPLPEPEESSFALLMKKYKK